MVLSGLVTAWRFAGWPMRRSPSLVKATTEGGVRAPSVFSMTFGLPPSMTATQLLVVPKSIPMTLAMVLYPSSTSPIRPQRGDRNADFSGDIGAMNWATRSAVRKLSAGSRHHHSAVDVDRLAGDVSRFLRREINAGGANIVAAAHRAHRNPRQ